MSKTIGKLAAAALFLLALRLIDPEPVLTAGLCNDVCWVCSVHQAGQFETTSCDQYGWCLGYCFWPDGYEVQPCVAPPSYSPGCY